MSGGDDDGPARPPRSLSRWVVLFVVYIVGLIVWGAYIAALVFLFFRFLV